MGTIIDKNGQSYQSSIDPRTNKVIDPTTTIDLSGYTVPTTSIPSPYASSVMPTVTPTASAGAIAGAKPIVTPTPIPQTGANGFQEYLASLNNSNKTTDTTIPVDKTVADTKTAYDSSSSLLEKAFSALGLQSSKNNDIYIQEGVDTAKKQVDEYTSQLEAEQLSNRRRIEDLQKNNTNGLFGGALTSEVNRINNESLSKQADIAILQNAALRKYDTASAIADRKIAVETEGLKNEIEMRKFFFEQNKDNWTRAEQRQYDEVTKQKDRVYQETIDSKKAIQSIVIDAAQQGAPANLLQQAQQAKTPEEAAGLLGKYSSAYLDRQLKQAQLNETYANIAKINAEATPDQFTTPPIVNPDTGKLDPTSQIAAAVAGSSLKNNDLMQKITGVISSTQQFAQNLDNSGGIPGTGTFAPPPLFVGPKGQDNLTSLNAISLAVGQWASGANLSTKQQEQVDSFTPKASDANWQIRNKLNSLTNFMLSQAKSQFASQGYNFSPEKIDYFKPIVTAPDGTQIQITD